MPDDLEDLARRAAAAMADGPRTSAQLADMLGTTEDRAIAALQSLRRAGLVRFRCPKWLRVQPKPSPLPPPPPTDAELFRAAGWTGAVRSQFGVVELRSAAGREVGHYVPATGCGRVVGHPPRHYGSPGAVVEHVRLTEPRRPPSTDRRAA